MQKIGIIGCGWLGLHIAQHLKPNYKINATVRSSSKRDELAHLDINAELKSFSEVETNDTDQPWTHLHNMDAIIISIPFSKSANYDNLQVKFNNIKNFIKGYKGSLFLLSSIGIYPQISMEINETSFSNDQLNPTILGIEMMITKAFPQTNILRLAGLMGGTRVFSKYQFSDPNQVVNHVHYMDICRCIEVMLLSKTTSKIYNIVAPLHPTKQEVYDYQTKINLEPKSNTKIGRTIISTLVEQELDFEFSYPDPKQFNRL